MSDQNFTLEFDINTQQVEAMIAALTRMQTAANNAAGAAGNLNATRNNSTTQAVSEADKFMAALQRQAAQAGKTRTEILAMQAAQNGVSQQAAPLIAQINGASNSMHGFSMASSRSRSELIVLAHELSQGNFRRFGSSMMVLAESTGAASLLFSAAGLAALTLVGGIAAVAIAAYQGGAEMKKFNAEMAMTSNFAGLTMSGLENAAEAISTKFNLSIGQAKDAMMSLASTGRFTREELSLLGPAMAIQAKVSHASIEDLIGEYVKLADHPMEYARQQNASWHFIQPNMMEHLQMLVDTGNKEQAVYEISQLVASHMKGEGLNALKENASWWDNLSSSISRAWDQLKKFGSSQVTAASVAQERAELANMKSAKANAKSNPLSALSPSEFGYSDSEIAALEAKIAADQKKLDSAEDKAIKQSSDAAADRIRQAAQQRLDAIDHARKASYLKQEALDQLERDRKVVMADPKLADDPKNSPAAFAARKAQIEKEYTTATMRKAGNDAYRAHLLELAGLQQQEVIDYQTTEQKIKAQLEDGAISYDQYVDQITEAKKKELSLQAGHAQEAIAIAKKHSDITKAEQQKMLNDYNKYNAEMGEADEKAKQMKIKHNTEIIQIMERYEAQADALLAKDVAHNKKALDTLYATPNEKAKIGAADTITSNFAALAERTKTDPKLTALGNESDLARALNTIKKDQEAALEANDEYYAALAEKQSNWKNGAIQSMNEYLEKSKDVAGQTKQAFDNAFQNMEDALVNLVMTGKLNFKSLATSIIGDIVRMEIKAAASSIFKYFGYGSAGSGVFSGTTEAGVDTIASAMFATGGVIQGGIKKYAGGGMTNGPEYFPMASGVGMRGEQGGEAIMPTKRMPNGNLGVQVQGMSGSTAVYNTVNVTVQGGKTNEETGNATAHATVKAMQQIADKQIVNSRRPGGIQNPFASKGF